jgi:ATP-dependent Clp protease ATP-binding subunit ClpA
MKISRELNSIITTAISKARNLKHEYITPEHLLYSSLFFKSSLELLRNCGGNIEELKDDLEKFFSKSYIPVIENREPVQSVGFHNILEDAMLHVASAGKDILEIGDVLASIYNERESFAASFLVKHGVTRIALLNFISHGITVINEEERDTTQTVTEKSKKREATFLSKYALELVDFAKKDELDPVICRDSIIERTIQVLCRRNKNNPVHVGEIGVGKTAITYGLARKIANDDVPYVLKGTKIYQMDLGGLVAGTKYRGDFEDRIKKVMDELMGIDGAILFIDEIHNLVGAGAVNSGSMDASNIIKPLLSRRRLHCIGSSTYEEYNKFFDKDKGLSRRFQKIDVPEPSFDEAVRMLYGIKERFEEFHKIRYSKSAIENAVDLSAKYINDRFLPDKAIDVIDEAGAGISMRRKKGDLKYINVSKKKIEQTVAKIARIPQKSISENESQKLHKLHKELKNIIFGQEKAVDVVTQAIKSSRAGFRDLEKPVSSLLFVGPTGVGKTELSKQIAKLLQIEFLRFDMSEYQEKHTVARLIGSPPGYVGYEQGGLLTDAVRKNPHSVLLLDEIEKAHPDIFNTLLQIMDYATLTDSSGRKADFKNIIIIMTSNAGARKIDQSLIGFGSDKNSSDNSDINKAVEKHFSPEFRNRLDNIIVFNRLSMAVMLKIVVQKMDEFSAQLSKKNVTVSVSQECCKWIANKAYSTIFGARELARVIDKNVKTLFVDDVLFGRLKNGGTVKLDIVKNEPKIIY